MGRLENHLEGPPAKSPALKPGDTVGVVSLAAAVEQKALERGLELIHSIGFHARVSRHVLERDDILAGSDRQRAEELQAFFADPDIPAPQTHLFWRPAYRAAARCAQRSPERAPSARAFARDRALQRLKLWTNPSRKGRNRAGRVERMLSERRRGSDPKERLRRRQAHNRAAMVRCSPRRPQSQRQNVQRPQILHPNAPRSKGRSPLSV